MNISISADFDYWNGTILSGLCHYESALHYFHWMAGADFPIYYVYDIDYIPTLSNGWKDLDQFLKIGEFSIGDICEVDWSHFTNPISQVESL